MKRPEFLKQTIRDHRQVIRVHRDQKGDDRCWLDDYLVWAVLEDSPAEPERPIPLATALESCYEFYTCRRQEKLDSTPSDAILDPAWWDRDLETLSGEQLQACLEQIQIVIRKHRDVFFRPRTTQDDQALYAVLPEKIPADFRLPPEDAFLGSDNPNAGCPNFWKSHTACNPSQCNLHHWGPCP